MAIEAFGQYSNKYSNKTQAGRALNRKVVIAISRYAMDTDKQPEDVKEGSHPGATDAYDNENTGKAGNTDIEVVRGEGNSIELNFSGN